MRSMCACLPPLQVARPTEYSLRWFEEWTRKPAEYSKQGGNDQQYVAYEVRAYCLYCCLCGVLAAMFLPLQCSVGRHLLAWAVPKMPWVAALARRRLSAHPPHKMPTTSTPSLARESSAKASAAPIGCKNRRKGALRICPAMQMNEAHFQTCERLSGGILGHPGYLALIVAPYLFPADE